MQALIFASDDGERAARSAAERPYFVLDDDARVRESTRRLLRTLGFEAEMFSPAEIC